MLTLEISYSAVFRIYKFLEFVFQAFIMFKNFMKIWIISVVSVLF